MARQEATRFDSEQPLRAEANYSFKGIFQALRHQTTFRKLDLIEFSGHNAPSATALPLPTPCRSAKFPTTITPLWVDQMQSLFRQILRVIDRLGPTEWVVVLGVVIVIGLVCMKGFGSRSSY